jgi:hypothetical protein
LDLQRDGGNADGLGNIARDPRRDRARWCRPCKTALYRVGPATRDRTEQSSTTLNSDKGDAAATGASRSYPTPCKQASGTAGARTHVAFIMSKYDVQDKPYRSSPAPGR